MGFLKRIGSPRTGIAHSSGLGDIVSGKIWRLLGGAVDSLSSSTSLTNRKLKKPKNKNYSMVYKAANLGDSLQTAVQEALRFNSDALSRFTAGRSENNMEDDKRPKLRVKRVKIGKGVDSDLQEIQDNHTETAFMGL